MADSTTSQMPLISTILGLVSAYGAAKGIPAIDNATLTSIAPYVSGALGGLGVAAGGGTGIAPIDNLISKVASSPQAATVSGSLDKSVSPAVAATPLITPIEEAIQTMQDAMARRAAAQKDIDTLKAAADKPDATKVPAA
jgi:hypothetical protein